MKNKPLLSIVVPAYNVEKYIERCLASIMRQTYGNLQIIVVDDGSTDNTGKLCDQIAVLDARIEVYHTVNGGLVAARKEGLGQAKGEYVGFVDGDDYIEEVMYEKLLENIMETKADFVHSCYIENAEGNEKDMILVPECVLEMENEGENVKVLVDYVIEKKAGYFIIPSVCSKLFRREFIMECYAKVPNEQQYGEDMLCLYHSIFRAKKVSLMARAYYHYIVRPMSLSHVDGQTRFMKEVSLSHYIIKAINEYGFANKLREKIYNYLRRIMLNFFELEEKSGARVPKFYYEKVEEIRGKRIVLYGAGRVGKDYYAQICKYQDCKIVMWVDKNWEKVDLDYAKVNSV